MISRPLTNLRKKLLFLLVPTLIGVIYLGSTVLSSSPKSRKGIIRVHNLTHSCDLSKVERHSDHIVVTVQNNSDKAITAFVLTSLIDPKTVYTMREEFAFSEGDNVIPPGQSYDKVIGISSGLSRQSEINLNLSAITYEDGSSEGDPKAIRDTLDSRLGRKTQIMKILPVLDKVSQLPDTELALRWNKTVRQDFEAALNTPNIDSLRKLNNKPLNNDAPYEESEQFKLGVQAGREDIIRKYQELTDIKEKQGTIAMHESILRLNRLYSKMVHRL